MQAPPSRYRVIERGGRLVVIDSAVGGAPLAAKDLLPAMASDDGSEALSLGQFPREGGDPGSQARTPETLDPRLRGETDRVRPTAKPLTTEPPGFLSNVASTVCSDRRDDGRLQWTTAGWYDAKGPRTIALSDTAEQRLGFVALALLVVTVGAVVMAVGFGWFGFAIMFVALSLLRQAKPVATQWIDRLTAT